MDPGRDYIREYLSYLCHLRQTSAEDFGSLHKSSYLTILVKKVDCNKGLAFLLLAILFVLQFGCNTPEQSQTRVSQLLREIADIARRSTNEKPSAGIVPIVQRINENKKQFPDTREELKTDADMVMRWYAEKEGESRLMDGKYQEILTLVSEGREVLCFQALKDINSYGIEQGLLITSQYELFDDETITSREALEVRTEELNNRIRVLSENKDRRKQVQISNCPAELK